jgi:hypothetical protein
MWADWAQVEMAYRNAEPCPHFSRQLLCPLHFGRVEIDVGVEITDHGVGHEIAPLPPKLGLIQSNSSAGLCPAGEHRGPECINSADTVVSKTMSNIWTHRGLGLAVAAFCALAVPAPASASLETPAAKAEASAAAFMARIDMEQVFGSKQLKAGQYVWRKGSFAGEPRVVVSIPDQLAYLYRGEELVAVSTISTGVDKHPTPTGIFSVRLKKPMHRSIKYDLAPMPFMQMIDEYGIALHAGHNPGYRASHGCIRLPAEFAKRLYAITDLGATVMIGA